jgi:hypothetical protein
MFFLKSLFNKSYSIPFLLFFITLAVYIRNLSPGVYGGDSGDILTAAITWGVPHPSGYPLITLLGAIFIKFLPFGISAAWKFGFLNSLISSGSVVLFYFTVKRLTNNKYIAISASLTLGFCFPFWLYAEVVEVMALYYFFIVLLIYLTVEYLYTKKEKMLYLLAFFAGLSLTNNQAIVLLFPAIGIAIIASNWRLIKNWKIILVCFILALVGLTPYLYIPIAALNSPATNSGNAVNINNFIYLILRRQYGWGSVDPKLFSFDLFLLNLKVYFNYWKIYVNLIIPFFSLLSLIYFIKNNKRILFFFFLTQILVTSGFYLFYARVELSELSMIAALEKFYTQSIIIFLIVYPLGVIFIWNIISKYLKNPLPKYIVLISLISVFIIEPLSFFRRNVTRLNLSNIYTGNNFGSDILTPLDKDSVLLIQGDNYAYTTLYNQLGLGVRKDVYIPGIHNGFSLLLANNGLDQTQIKDYQLLHQNSLNDKNMVYIAILNLLLQGKSVYTNANVELSEQQKDIKVYSIPYGLLYKLVLVQKNSKGQVISQKDYFNNLDKITDGYHIQELYDSANIISDHVYLSAIRRLYAEGFVRVADYVWQNYGDREKQIYYLNKAFKIDPTF